MLKLYSFNYSLLLSFIILTVLITVVLAAVSIGLSWNSAAGGTEVSNAYECGFLPFDRARTAFDVRFFLVGLLFLLFDLEVVVLLPTIPIVYDFTLVQFGCFGGFVAVLGLCFTFELLRHALDF